MRWASSLAILGCIVCVSALHADSADWPVFRGNALQTGVADVRIPDVLAVRWSFKTGEAVTGAPVIARQTVYIGALDGNLYALDLLTGKQKWAYRAVAFKTTPAVGKDAVYIGDMHGTFHCVDIATGTRHWTVPTDAQIASPANFAGNRVLFGSDDHHLYCVGTDGKLAWRYKTKEKVQCAPAVVAEQVFVASCDQFLHLVDLDKGIAVGTVGLGGHVGASAAVHGDNLYIGNMANQFLALDWKQRKVLWQFEAQRSPQPFFACAAVTEELVVTGSRDKQVRAFQRSSGNVAWSFATKGKVDSSPVVARKRVIVGSADGNLYVLDLDSGTPISRISLGSPITNAAALTDGLVVVATFGGQVYCLGSK
jgi:outer membrane protein assembly factor BamB